MIQEGLLDGDLRPDAAFAIHQTPTIPTGLVATRPGPMLAATNQLHIVVRGRGGHASMPHHAVDPIPVACEIVTALQSFVTRRVDAFDPAVVTVARISSGTTVNVIPEEATLEGTIRTFSEATRAAVVEGIGRLAAGIAGAHDCEADVSLDAGYPVTVNDDDFAAFTGAVAARLLGDERSITMPSPVMGAEDFSYVLQQVPGAMAFLGTRPQGVGRNAAPNHSNRMVLDEDAMATGIALNAAIALAFDTPA
jgi:hippurate hydrolase